MLTRMLLVFCILISATMCVCLLPTAAFGDGTTVAVVIDGETVDFGEEQAPFLAESGRVLVPMRKIFETIGASVDWEDETHTVTAIKDSTTVVLKIGDKAAKKNNDVVELDQPPELVNGRTMVPLRFVGEALGAKVEWIDETKTVLLTIQSVEAVIGSPVTKKDNIKIAVVGNSFSQDAAAYLHDIAAADGVNITIANLYIGGCSLMTHWLCASGNINDYQYELNGKPLQKVSLKEALEMDDWNYVIMQQVSQNSGKEDTYYPYIEDLAKYIKEIEPGAELVIHQTWAYEKGSDHSGFGNYNGSQEFMFNMIKKAYDKAAVKVGKLTASDGTPLSKDNKPLRIIPSGKAFQNARANEIFNTTFKDGEKIRLNRDGYHASIDYGRYLLGALWYECFTGNKIENNTFRTSGSSKNELDILKKAAHDAAVEYGWQ